MRLFRSACALVLLHFTLTACSENAQPPQLGTFVYGKATGHCPSGARPGPAGATDGKVSPYGIKYMVRTPSNYDAAVTHPLLMVYAPAGQSRWASEGLTGLTTAATGAGFIVVYADHLQLNIPAIEWLGAIPGQIATEWCIDQKRVFITGHSDGGTATLALAVLEQTRTIPASVAPSAAGWTGKDLEEFQCREPIPVMIMHSKNDSLFPGWGAQTSAWWARCNRCDVTKTKPVKGGCRAYQGCAPNGATLYCEGAGSHREWPNLNRVMLEFFAHPDKFQ
ncbi:MAG: hypothetical protein P0120_23780 [Nitrospira sp.]|nr:hypothetical protein [Nitrospira sp.]